MRLALISATAFALIGPELVGTWRILTKPSASPPARSAPVGITNPPPRAPEPVKIEGLLDVRFVGASAADYRDLPSWRPGEPTNSVAQFFAVKNESRLFVSYFALNLSLVDSWGQTLANGVLRGENIRPGFTVEPCS